MRTLTVDEVEEVGGAALPFAFYTAAAYLAPKIVYAAGWTAGAALTIGAYAVTTTSNNE